MLAGRLERLDTAEAPEHERQTAAWAEDDATDSRVGICRHECELREVERTCERDIDDAEDACLQPALTQVSTRPLEKPIPAAFDCSATAVKRTLIEATHELHRRAHPRAQPERLKGP